MNYADSLQKYRDGIDELLFVKPVFGSVARAMGTPVWDESQNTAYVTFDGDTGTIMFAFNPDFIMTLSTEEVAAVIAHETHHVALDHLPEMMSGDYPNADALRKAHECIINDTIDTVFQLPLPNIGVFRGPDLCGQDCSFMSTRMAYDIFDNQPEQEPQPDPDCPQHGDKSQDQSEDKSDDGDFDESGDDESNGGQDGDQDNDESGDQDGGQDGEGGQDGDQDGTGNSGADGEVAGDGDPSGDHSHGQAGPPCTCPPQNGGCGGVVVPDGMEQEAKQAIKDVMDQAAQDMGMTPQEMQEAIDGSQPNTYSPTGAPVSEKTQISAERMNWKLLLARINPKVMESGRVRSKTRNNWTTYNRRMGSIYPKAILPKTERVKPKPKDKGDALPVLVVALDLSGSIDRSLVQMLQGLLNEIPTSLIKAYPATWGSNLIPYVEGGQVAGGGTNIDNVAVYVDQVKAESGTDPYVLVISDGEFYNSHRRPGREWFFMSVDKSSVRNFGPNGYRHVQDLAEVYLVDDFRV